MFFKLDLKNEAVSGRRSSREMRIAFRGDLLIVIRSSREMRIAFRGDLLIVIRSSREMRIAFRGDLDCRVALRAPRNDTTGDCLASLAMTSYSYVQKNNC